MNVQEDFTRAARAIRDADALLITAGAGMGVDSGLPDFRGNEGFWKAYPPMAILGISFVEMANPTWFDHDPNLAWGFYGHRLNLYRQTAPHRGFTQLLEIGRHKRGGYFVFTSNVDGQFQKAGFAEDHVEECHGSVHHLQCTQPCSAGIWDARNERVAVDEDTFRAKEPLPRCKHCSGMARPNVLMFGDWSWISTRADSQSGRRAAWLKGISEAGLRLAIVELGAGEAVATVRRQSEHIARAHGAILIRINPRDFRVPRGEDVSLPFGAAEGVGGIVDALRAQ
ncbi:MAG: SIR2 family NAD-dependent protein deacylase [Nitrospirota bacterium]